MEGRAEHNLTVEDLCTVTCIVGWVENFVLERHIGPYSWSTLKREEICSSEILSFMYKAHKATRWYKTITIAITLMDKGTYEICKRLLLNSKETLHLSSKPNTSTLHRSLKHIRT